MAQKLNFKSCLGCIHLQKENPIISGDMALYQCTSQKRNRRCVGWVQKDVFLRYRRCGKSIERNGEDEI